MLVRLLLFLFNLNVFHSINFCLYLESIFEKYHDFVGEVFEVALNKGRLGIGKKASFIE